MRLPQATLRGGVNRLEDAIITLSGPALAISGIIAGVDLLTGGNAMRQYGGLALAWAICLLLTLDFQVLGLGAKAHKVYLSDKAGRRKVTEIVLAVLIAASISYVSVQMQSIIARANSVGISVEQATMQLGINPIALTWERSALVLVLIFMSGWFREEQQQQQQPETLSDETMQVILAKLARLDTLEQALTDQSVSIQTLSATAETAALPPPVQAETDVSAVSHVDLPALARLLPGVSEHEANLVVEAYHHGIPRREICASLKWGSGKYSTIVKPVLDAIDQQHQ